MHTVTFFNYCNSIWPFTHYGNILNYMKFVTFGRTNSANESSVWYLQFILNRKEQNSQKKNMVSINYNLK